MASTPVIGAIYNRPGDYYDRLILRNYPRWFKVHIPPSYQPDLSMALVFNLHGLGSNLDEQELLSGMTAKADEAGFIVVYPQAGASVWNIQAGEIGAIDVNFIRELIGYLETKLNIDPARIYATGFSNGGGMVHRLACDLSDRIAAIAPVAGAHMPDQPCEPERPVPVLAIHGTADPFAPYLDERVGQNIPQWAADWAARNGCNPAPVSQEQGPGIYVESWGGCEANASVVIYRIEGVGHTWPGSPLGNAWGPNTQDLIANDVIWQFFTAHPRP
jgi:polyhydroxybutyrate depolymerase